MIAKEHILQLIASSNWEALTQHLSHLSNMDFRKAERTIRESILPTLPSDQFWCAMLHLIKYKKQAFMTGMLALNKQLTRTPSTLQSNEARNFSTFIAKEHPEAMAKMVNMALPQLSSEEQIEDLFRLFDIHDGRLRVASLLKAPSPLTYFALFKTLKMMPGNQDLVRKCCIHIMKSGSDQAFNMASILRAYFGIEGMKSQMSLSIDTFELNYLDRNYDTFLHILNGRRPKI